ncbi:hypothetical protein Vadar_022910 [Vaccinium darrowii]|uniref:Uncharacterized protein n=1 Tax=Vaccinium darrowii TaxID=229202 RepID=A0ACB7YHI1_9ERIC|nr:hypothetical protein Vadar_022910 [Vaccinium darrowii]
MADSAVGGFGSGAAWTSFGLGLSRRIGIPIPNGINSGVRVGSTHITPPLSAASPLGSIVDAIFSNSSCSVFSKVAEDTDVLKAVCFHDMIINPCGLFQQTNGLLHKCARVGNAAAQYLLAKVILMSSSQLLPAVRKGGHTSFGSQRMNISECLCKMPQDDDNVVAANFMAHFAPDQACSTKYPSQTLLHSELVRNFLCQCSAHDVTLMHLHLNAYVDCFAEHGSRGNYVLHYLINKMCHYGHRVIGLGGETLEDKKREMKEMFAEKMEQLLAWKIARESDQGAVTEENHNEFVELSRAEWLLVSSSVFPDKTYASIGDLELDGLAFLYRLIHHNKRVLEIAAVEQNRLLGRALGPGRLGSRRDVDVLRLEYPYMAVVAGKRRWNLEVGRDEGAEAEE